MLTDLLNRFIASLTYATSLTRYGLLVPSRMHQAMLDMNQLEAEVQRLQDLTTAMQKKQDSLQFYMQDSRRYRQLRNSVATSAGLSVQHHGELIRGAQLDYVTDLFAGTQTDYADTYCTLGLPALQLLTDK